MLDSVSDVARGAALLAAGGLALFVASDLRARGGAAVEQRRDATRWTQVGFVFFALSFFAFERGSGLLRVIGVSMRDFAKSHGLYNGRHDFQVMATFAVIMLAVLVFVRGLRFLREQRGAHHLALSFAAVSVGFWLVSFVSLHQVDYVLYKAPWIGLAADLIASIGAACVALSKLNRDRRLVDAA